LHWKEIEHSSIAGGLITGGTYLPTRVLQFGSETSFHLHVGVLAQPGLTGASVAGGGRELGSKCEPHVLATYAHRDEIAWHVPTTAPLSVNCLLPKLLPAAEPRLKSIARGTDVSVPIATDDEHVARTLNVRVTGVLHPSITVNSNVYKPALSGTKLAVGAWLFVIDLVELTAVLDSPGAWMSTHWYDSVSPAGKLTVAVSGTRVNRVPESCTFDEAAKPTVGIELHDAPSAARAVASVQPSAIVSDTE
jgi:hypothetical protein